MRRVAWACLLAGGMVGGLLHGFRDLGHPPRMARPWAAPQFDERIAELCVRAALNASPAEDSSPQTSPKTAKAP